MRRLIGLARRISADRKGGTTFEYGLTAALAVGLILSAFMAVQGTAFAHAAGKCYTLGSADPLK